MLLTGHNFPALRLINSSHFLSGLSRRNIFMDQATTVDSLWNQFGCWVYSERTLSSSSEFPLKTSPTVGSPFILDLLYPLLFVLHVWYLVAVHLYTPDPLHGRRKNKIVRVVQGMLGLVLGQVSQNGCSLALYVSCLASPCFTYTSFTYTMLTWMCLPPTP